MDAMLWEIGETATALRRAFDRRASALGVTRAQWRVLARLSRTPGLRQVELADQLDMEADHLCAGSSIGWPRPGLVERQPDPAGSPRVEAGADRQGGAARQDASAHWPMTSPRRRWPGCDRDQRAADAGGAWTGFETMSR